MTKKRVRKAQKRIPLEEAMMTLPDLHAERDLLQARFVQSTRQLSALYTGPGWHPRTPPSRSWLAHTTNYRASAALP